MVPLPIVQRELRVAARKASTYWGRVFAVLLIVGFFGLILMTARQPIGIGSVLFGVQAWVAFLVAMVAGLRYTADCISEERREGTIGLLFLTDLRGYDVVLGKLIATSITAFYNLLAIIPLLALPILFGGIYFGQFGRLVLLLVVTMFYSLSLGIVISTFSSSLREAFFRTVVALVSVSVLFPVIHQMLRHVFFHPVFDWLFLYPSPTSTLIVVHTGGFPFSEGIYAMLGLGVLCLVVSSIGIQRVWHEKTRVTKKTKRVLRPVGSENPLCWHGLRERWPFQKIFTAFIILYLLLAIVLPNRPAASAFIMFKMFGALGIHIAYKVFLGIQATRQFHELKSSGALELILVTPMSARAMVAGASNALFRSSRGLFIWLHVVNLVGFIVLQDAMGVKSDEELLVTFFGGGLMLLWVDRFGLIWVGLLTGLRKSKFHRLLMAVFNRLMLPSYLGLVLIFLLGTVGSVRSTDSLMVLFWIWIVSSGLWVMALGVKARRQIFTDFRALAVDDLRVAANPVGQIPPLLRREPPPLPKGWARAAD